ncbi:hypothetical protein BJY04DRAFT_180790 [Aspergillus karnatakaensis]|uniref:transcription factor domain-containing protein n=1 Tax=Aspergillus karnatakaensis TaxID=1810916 RepID=UPI003CCD8891
MMELTWLADTPQSRRRTRALRACPSCQKRKKRCRHLGSTTDMIKASVRADKPCAPTRPTETPLARPTVALASSRISRIERFVGDLNPEAAIRERVDGPDQAHLRDQIGLWINGPAPKACSQNEQEFTTTIATRYPAEQGPGKHSIASTLYGRYLSALKACNRLPSSTVDHLASVYFARVNRILPLVDHKSFIADSATGAASILLERAICLVAAKDRAAAPYLRLETDGATVATRDFCSEIYNGLVCAMDAGIEQDRISRIRTLALMSLHSEGYEGAEAASMHLCQALHQAQTAGLHLERPDRSPEDSLTNLFWCVWTLDKMHASIGGRPVLLAERDIGIKRPNITSGQLKSAFDVWFALSELLSTVISFYRPSVDETIGWEMDYPSFEDIIGEHPQQELDSAALGVLEIYYHAISILSCRYRPTQRLDGSKPSYTRQGLAALRIYSLISTECAQDLPPLPIVPYAVALSMGVSYQQFRSSKLITHLGRARSSLEACCALLEDLGTSWYSAEAMARLGRKALRQIDDAHPGETPPSSGFMLSTIAKHSRGNIEHNPSNLIKQGMSRVSTQPITTSSNAKIQQESNLADAIVPDQHGLQHVDGKLFTEDVVGGDGFADIDMLFDDFLDLSLPTNFWDPVFFSPEDRRDV